MIKNKKGFVSVEAIISMATLMIMFVVCIGFFVYTMPKLTLEKEVHLLAQKAKIQGGLTYEDVDTLKLSLERKGYDVDQVVVNAVTVASSDGMGGGLNAIGVDPLSDRTGVNYIKRSDMTPIEITVIVPANLKLLSGGLTHFFLGQTLNDKYYVRETVMSERW